MKLPVRIALGAILPIALVVLYAVGTALAPNPFLPPIPKILDTFADLWLFSRVPTDLVPSLLNLLWGYLIAAVCGIGLGLLLGRLLWVRELLMPLLHLARSVPPLMLIPPLVLVLGIGDISKIAIIALGSFFPILLATIDGVRQTDPALIDAASALRLTAVQRLVHVWIRSSTPSMFGGLQTGLQFALVLMVASEMVAATRGVGYVTMQAQLTFNAPAVWAGMLLLAIVGFALNQIFVWIRNRALAWHIGMRAQTRAR